MRFGVPLLALIGTLSAPSATLADATMPRPHPAIAGVGVPVPLDIAAVSPTDVWALGVHHHRHYQHDDTMYASHWDGATWTTYPTPSPGVHRTHPSGMDAVSSTDIWAVGNYADSITGPAHTLAVHWDGESWTQSHSRDVGAEGSALNAVSAVSTDDVWAVGGVIDSGSSASTLTEHWDGNRWKVVPSPNASGAETTGLSSVTALSTDDVWAFGSFYASTKEQLLAEHWNGTRWKIVPMDDPGHLGGYLSASYAPAIDDVWAVGTNYTVPQHPVIEHWDGTVWTAVEAPAPGRFSRLVSVDGTSSTDIWAVGDEYRKGPDPLFIVHWDGVAWSDASILDRPEGSSGYLFGVATDASDDAWAVGQEYDPTGGHEGTGRQVQLRLHWDGTTWS